MKSRIKIKMMIKTTPPSSAWSARPRADSFPTPLRHRISLGVCLPHNVISGTTDRPRSPGREGSVATSVLSHACAGRASPAVCPCHPWPVAPFNAYQRLIAVAKSCAERAHQTPAHSLPKFYAPLARGVQPWRTQNTKFDSVNVAPGCLPASRVTLLARWSAGCRKVCRAD
jgi:hypothetical protein